MNKRRLIVALGILLLSTHTMHGWSWFFGTKQEQPSKESAEWFNKIITALNDIRSQIKDFSSVFFVAISEKTINKNLLVDAKTTIDNKLKKITSLYGEHKEIEKKITEEQRKIYTPLSATTAEEAKKFFAAVDNMIKNISQQHVQSPQTSSYQGPTSTGDKVIDDLNAYYREQEREKQTSSYQGPTSTGDKVIDDLNAYYREQEREKQKSSYQSAQNSSTQDIKKRDQNLVAQEAKKLVASINDFYIPNPSTLTEDEGARFIDSVISFNNDVAMQLKILDIKKYGLHYSDIDNAYTKKIEKIENAVSTHFRGGIYTTISALHDLRNPSEPNRIDRYREIRANVAILKQVIDSIPNLLSAKLNYDYSMDNLNKALQETGKALGLDY